MSHPAEGTPPATGSVVPPPTAPAPSVAPSPSIGPAPPAPGVAQPHAATAARRSRHPHGPMPIGTTTGSQGIPAMLELAAAVPMFTDQRRSPNIFFPDATFVFLVLSQMDLMMNTTHRFTQSAPMWLPLVSHIYVSILWILQVMRVYVNSHYGIEHAQVLEVLINTLRLDEAEVPGPLVPFFEALAAINGPFEWIGDIIPGLPPAPNAFPADQAHAIIHILRSIPFPALQLDQLIDFARTAGNDGTYGTYQWYANIFSCGAAHLDHGTHDVNLNRLGPNFVASLFTTEAQHNSARTFWASILPATRITRIDAVTNAFAFTNWIQILGFNSLDGNPQIEWFQQVAICMQKYCKFFNGSRPLKTIPLTGIGAIAITGYPTMSTAIRDWIYPNGLPGPARSNAIAPIHEVPNRFSFAFEHADHELEEIAEQYAILSHVNLQWSHVIIVQHGHTAIDEAVTHTGTYWSMEAHRRANHIDLHFQFAQLIASRYHQANANRST